MNWNECENKRRRNNNSNNEQRDLDYLDADADAGWVGRRVGEYATICRYVFRSSPILFSLRHCTHFPFLPVFIRLLNKFIEFYINIRRCQKDFDYRCCCFCCVCAVRIDGIHSIGWKWCTVASLEWGLSAHHSTHCVCACVCGVQLEQFHSVIYRREQERKYEFCVIVANACNDK